MQIFKKLLGEGVNKKLNPNQMEILIVLFFWKGITMEPKPITDKILNAIAVFYVWNTNKNN